MLRGTTLFNVLARAFRRAARVAVNLHAQGDWRGEIFVGSFKWRFGLILSSCPKSN